MKIAGLITVALISLAPAFGSPLLLVVPNASTSTTGNAQDSLGDANQIGNIELEEDFGAGQFIGAAGGEDLLISQLAFRAAPDTGGVTLTTVCAALARKSGRAQKP